MQQASDIITLTAGAYRLREPLARSAYGVLWRADGPGIPGTVALKLVNREQMARAEAHQRARWTTCAANEIAFLRSLQPWDQRHIVRLVDSGQHEGLPAMALELLDGDLGRHVAAQRSAERPIPFAQALDWLAQVNQALAKVHQYGWRYLDLKPANLLLDARRGHLKLADFGTNRLLRDLHPHSYAGTPNWQAPEQFFPDAGAAYRTDGRTDYFAMGALFFYLVTGGLPLRFCSACGEARAAHGSAAASVLRQRHGGALPPVLQEDEAVLFTQSIERQVDEPPRHSRAGGNPYHAGTSTRLREAALALLRTLLAVRSEDRPRHALDISRAISGIRLQLKAPVSGALRRAA